MEFYGYHGVLPEETQLGQRFQVDVVLDVNLHQAGKTDDLAQTVSYAEVYDICKEVTENRTYKLIEAVAENIAEIILKQYERVNSVTVKVIKPNPPIHGIYQSVAVEIVRERL